jgi:putative ABC transport system permease protein
VLRTQLRGLAARPSRLLLTAVSVAVATAFAFATSLTAGMLERTVIDNLSGTPAATSLVADGTGVRPLTGRTITTIERTPGVAEAVGRIQASPPVGGVAGDAEGNTWDLIGDPGAGPLSMLDVTAGTYPRRTGEVAVSEGTAERTGLRPGSRLTLVPLNGGPRVVTVSSVVTFGEDNAHLLFGLGPAVESLADGAGYFRVDIRAAPGTDVTALGDELRSRLGPDVEITTAAETRKREAQEVTASIKPLFALVSVFVLVAVLAAVLVTASTFRIVFAQRMAQLALLRTVGATRRSLVGALVAEGVMTGAVAGLLGVLAALGIAHGAAATLAALDHTVASPGFPLGTALACVAGAVAVTVAAVLAPALAASRVRPLEALRTAAVADMAPRGGRLRIAFGFLLIAGAVLAALPVLRTDGSDEPMALLLTVVGSGTAAFGALLALGPFVTPSLTRLLGWPLARVGGVSGKLAIRGAARAPRRVAATTAVVTLGVTLVCGVLVGNASLRGYADAQLAAEFPTDLLVTTPNESPVPPELVRALHRDDRLAHVAEARHVDGRVIAGDAALESRITGLRTADVPALAEIAMDGGSLRDVGPGRPALSRNGAAVLGVRTGDAVTLTVGRRHVSGHVAAVYDGSAALGSVVLDPADLRQLAPAGGVNSVLVDVRDPSAQGVDVARAAIVKTIGLGSTVTVLTPAQERAEIDQVLTVVSGVALGLLGLTVLIAVVGVATTMALTVIERTREFGLLRALGLGRRGLRASIAMESSLFGVVGALLGVGLGVLYGWLALRSLGLSAPLVLPLGSLAGTAALLAALSGFAGLAPSRRAARTSPVAVLASQ